MPDEHARSGGWVATLRAHRGVVAGALVLVLIACGVAAWLHQRHIAAALLRAEPDQILRDPALLRRAVSIGKPQYAEHCAGCHGAQLQGDPKRGVPDLARGVWLYGDAPVDVEHTVLYGIRSGHPMARNITDMPAVIRMGIITPDEARDAIEYLQSLARQPHDEAAALRGSAIYMGKGNCYDCHARDAKGVTDYGTPALTGPNWLYGGDRATLYQTLLNGRHGECPAWVNVLTPVQIRSVALYLVSAARKTALTDN